MSIENLMKDWDKLGLSWNNIDILGCILPNKEAHIVVISARRFLLRPAEHFDQCHKQAKPVKV